MANFLHVAGNTFELAAHYTWSDLDESMKKFHANGDRFPRAQFTTVDGGVVQFRLTDETPYAFSTDTKAHQVR